MRPVVADSSSIILLTKCNLLEDFCRHNDVVTSTAVREETASKTLIKKYPDAARIGKLIDQGCIKIIHQGEARLPIPFTIHRGEKEALLLCLKYKNALLATDDGQAIKAARFLNIPFIISPKIVVEMVYLGSISSRRGKASLEKLGKIGRYSPEIIAEALLFLQEVKNGQADDV
jgi:predicted nucleic acid-binding protein